MSYEKKKQKLLIEMIVRQTSYTFEEAERELIKNDNNYIKVIKQGLGINKKEKTEETINVNQSIYKEIRTLMDKSSMNYLINREQQEKKREIIEKVKKQQLQKNLIKSENEETFNNLEVIKEESELSVNEKKE